MHARMAPRRRCVCPDSRPNSGRVRCAPRRTPLGCVYNPSAAGLGERACEWNVGSTGQGLVASLASSITLRGTRKWVDFGLFFLFHDLVTCVLATSPESFRGISTGRDLRRTYQSGLFYLILEDLTPHFGGRARGSNVWNLVNPRN
jgi:hypothetical protein